MLGLEPRSDVFLAKFFDSITRVSPSQRATGSPIHCLMSERR